MSSKGSHIQWNMINHVFLTSSNLALYTSHCWARLLAPFASSFWAYSATFSSISRSFLRLLSSISMVRGVSTEALGCSSGLFGESSLTGGLTNRMVTNKFFFFHFWLLPEVKHFKLHVQYNIIEQARTKKRRKPIFFFIRMVLGRFCKTENAYQPDYD